MSPGYPGNVYLLAFDHRDSFRRALDLDADGADQQKQLISDAKQVIHEGLLAAASASDCPPGVGLIVDEEYGAEIADRARGAGLTLAMPVERSDQELFDFEYGDAFGEHIERFNPNLAKVLVRYNPDQEASDAEVQFERLRRLSDWLRSRGRRLLFELIVPPTDAQLAGVDSDARRYQAEVRPSLIERSMAIVQRFGIEVDVWKLEGVDSIDDARALVRQARSQPHRRRVNCTILGAGACTEQVWQWLRVSAQVEGFSGFAVGRTIWGDPIRAYLRDSTERSEAASEIAARFLDCVRLYEDARAARART